MIDPHCILAAHPAPVPRYTSYPTAPHFAAGSAITAERTMLEALDADEPVSLYLHVPFCDRLCWFCGCHTKQTRQYAPVAAYVGVLVEEMALIAEAAGFRIPVRHVHFGGGSPSMLQADDFARLATALADNFDLLEETEISVEIDPGDLGSQLLDGLGVLGVTRASIGVQDFDEDVQTAINRPQSFELTRETVASLRRLGIRSLNIDAVYGLPRQSMERLQRTIEQVMSLEPDRVALFGYAHVPWLKKHQQMIDEAELPDSLERFEQAEAAARLLTGAGFEKIGIDHFARPDDPLAIAARRGVLRRNFQGYTTDDCQTLIGLGASAISRFADGYVQNIVATGQYCAAVGNGCLAGHKSYVFTEDDRIRAHMIERLLCDFAIDLDRLEARFPDRAARYLRELADVADAESEGLCAMDKKARRFFIPPEARAFARIVAARFDAHLRETSFRYSKAV